MSASTSHRTIDVTHVVMDSTKPFADVQASLESLIPPIDDDILALRRAGITDRLKQRRLSHTN